MGVVVVPAPPLNSDRSLHGKLRVEAASSMSQGFHHQGGIFNFADGGFDRPTSQEQQQQAERQHQQHVAQQSRRDKLRVQGFDPSGQLLVHLGGEDDSGQAGGEPAIYESAASGNATNMLSEMFNFAAPPAHHGQPSASELLSASQIATAGPNYRLGLRPSLAASSMPAAALSAAEWYAGLNRQQGVTIGEASSSSKHHGPLVGIGTADSTAAMHMFLMNPQQHHQPRSPSPPSPATGHRSMEHPGHHHHHQTFPTFGNAAPFRSAGGGGLVEGQGLSLSLSSTLHNFDMAKAEESLRVRDGVLYFNSQGQQHPPLHLPAAPQGHSQLGPTAGGSSSSSTSQLHMAAAVAAGYSTAAGVATMLRNSKYARAARELLEEFCSVGRGQLKTGRSASATGRNLPVPAPTTGASTSAAPSSSSSKDAPPSLSPADRFEHQRKKAKLISMLDEVERRYSHYCDQMQMVVNFFDSVLGFGAAMPYTALAQKAMSRHFRCLKDAIVDQVKLTCELLGEKDAGSGSGITKGDTPRLRALDQSLRQQRAFHHMGVMEQEAWRPQRGLPERSVNILRGWLFEHFLHPYPSDADKHLLARQTGLSRNQVSNWFINARVRLWKPMIEDMYQQESKDNSDTDGGGGGGGGADAGGGGSSSTAADAHGGSASTHHHQPGQLHGYPQQTTPTVLLQQVHRPGSSGTTQLAGPSHQHYHHPHHHHNPDESMLLGIDPVELLGADAHVGPSELAMYHRYGPSPTMGPSSTRIGYRPSGDVSLTLGLQHTGGSGGGNAPPDGSRFAVRDFDGC